MISDIVSAVLLGIGAAFVLIAGIGIVRMPDLFMRLSAATKAGTLGLGCIVLAIMVQFGELGVVVRGLAIIGFGFLTAPIAAHMIGRAGYFMGVPLWERTIMDELRDRYNLRTHELESPPGMAPEAGAGGDDA